MGLAARTIFLHFDSTRVIAAVLFRGVISFFTLGASQGDDWANTFFLSHNSSIRSLVV
jgi:hypothetical protein